MELVLMNIVFSEPMCNFMFSVVIRHCGGTEDVENHVEDEEW